MFSVLSFNWLKMVTCANLANGSEFHSLGGHTEKVFPPGVFEALNLGFVDTKKSAEKYRSRVLDAEGIVVQKPGGLSGFF